MAIPDLESENHESGDSIIAKAALNLQRSQTLGELAFIKARYAYVAITGILLTEIDVFQETDQFLAILRNRYEQATGGETLPFGPVDETATTLRSILRNAGSHIQNVSRNRKENEDDNLATAILHDNPRIKFILGLVLAASEEGSGQVINGGAEGEADGQQDS